VEGAKVHFLAAEAERVKLMRRAADFILLPLLEESHLALVFLLQRRFHVENFSLLSVRLSPCQIAEKELHAHCPHIFRMLTTHLLLSPHDVLKRQFRCCTWRFLRKN